MKRAEPHYPTNDDPDAPSPSHQNLNLNPMNLVSDPVRCPFCVKTDFGVVYNPPAWLPSERRNDTPPREIATSPLSNEADLPADKREEMYPPGHEKVVLSDNIRPDWYQALAHRRRVEARRLATATALQQALAVAGQRRRSGSSRTAAQNGAGGSLGTTDLRRVGRRVDGIVRITRDEADEMMLQEAIRQSLQTQEEERKKREEEERKKAAAANTDETPSSSNPPPATSESSSPITVPVLPRLQPSTSTSPPSPRSFFPFRARSGSGSNRNESPTTANPLSATNRRPSSTNNLYPPVSPIRRKPSLPDALLTSTSVSLAAAMQDSIVPGAGDSRPSVSSPLASQAVKAPNMQVESVERTEAHERSTPSDTSVTTSTTVDEETVPMSSVANVTHEASALKSKDDARSIEEPEVLELTH